MQTVSAARRAIKRSGKNRAALPGMGVLGWDSVIAVIPPLRPARNAGLRSG